MIQNGPRVVVVGLGYVGLPLAIALARVVECWGLDINRTRIGELKQGVDRTNEITAGELLATPLTLTCEPADCPPADFYIVTVPTPVDDNNRPDLGPLAGAARAVGAMLDAGRKPVIIFESTVYPGVTEDFCAPLLSEASGLMAGLDFFVAYSPERINPGDREHTIDRITKVVAGENGEVLEKVAALYGAITSGGIFKARSIKVAEAAKVIENAQRDINIAFMNEITQIFSRLGISVWDVLDAASTKWNFLNFQPGLVGGHCIGVDPYYLSHRAEELGHDPRVILSGRDINDGMAAWVASELHAMVGRAGSVLMMGVTFKEDVPDLRNSKVADLIIELAARGHDIVLHDPYADPAEAEHEFGRPMDVDALNRTYDLVVVAVPHRPYRELGFDKISALVREGGILADLKNLFPSKADDHQVPRRWTL